MAINFHYVEIRLPRADYFVKGKIILKLPLTSRLSFANFASREYFKGGDDDVEYIGNYYWGGGHHYRSRPFGQLVEYVHQGVDGSRPHLTASNRCRCSRLFRQ